MSYHITNCSLISHPHKDVLILTYVPSFQYCIIDVFQLIVLSFFSYLRFFPSFPFFFSSSLCYFIFPFSLSFRLFLSSFFLLFYSFLFFFSTLLFLFPFPIFISFLHSSSFLFFLFSIFYFRWKQRTNVSVNLTCTYISSFMPSLSSPSLFLSFTHTLSLCLLFFLTFSISLSLSFYSSHSVFLFLSLCLSFFLTFSISYSYSISLPLFSLLKSTNEEYSQTSKKMSESLNARLSQETSR